ncbi:hypothetical protein MNBD_GAMMA21-2501 [hydrothermal vent metagenome]|uniref:NAD(P)-binding domain-containing protein n=1 Tax=hydrothermal vent metagenome TaxID=652676 RepID=A0A3B0ZV15_9ZZZZ
MKNILVVGASGATGRLLVQILLQKDIKVVAIVRAAASLTNVVDSHLNLQIVESEISKMSESDLAQYLKECDAVLSCLGHNLTFKGMFGHPRRLVTDVVERITRTIESISPNKDIKLVLMNTTGNSNRDIPEKPPLSQRLVISLLRLLLPPHVDNENAANFLRLHVGQNHKYIEWAAVRPDSLINEENVTPYDIYPSPIRNAIFDSAPTSRINVAEFMSELVINSDLWIKWKGKMPVIYNHV